MSPKLYPMSTHRRYTTGETGVGDTEEPAVLRQHLARPRTSSCVEFANTHVRTGAFINTLSDHFEVVSLESPRRSRRSSNTTHAQSSNVNNGRDQLGLTASYATRIDLDLQPTCVESKSTQSYSRTTRRPCRNTLAHQAVSMSKDSSICTSTDMVNEQVARRKEQMDVLLKTGIFKRLIVSILNGNAQVAVSDHEDFLTSSESDGSILEHIPRPNPGDGSSSISDELSYQASQFPWSHFTLRDFSKDQATQTSSMLTNASSIPTHTILAQDSATVPLSQLNNGSSFLGKRKCIEEDDEDEDVPNRGKGNKRCEPASQPNYTPALGLACHFNKFDSEKYSQGTTDGRSTYKACTNRFPNTAKIEQHFKEVHHYGDYDCPRCLRNLGNDRELSEHIRSSEPCIMLPNHVIEAELYLVRGSQRRDNLKMLGKKSTKVTTEKRWEQMWQAIFPGTDSPSPYRVPNPEECQFDRGLNLVLPSLVNEQSPFMQDLGPATVVSFHNEQIINDANQCWDWFQEHEEDFGRLLGNASEWLPDLSGFDGLFDLVPEYRLVTTNQASPPPAE